MALMPILLWYTHRIHISANTSARKNDIEAPIIPYFGIKMILHVTLKNGMIYNIGYQSKKDFIIVFNESNDIFFNTTTRKGTIKGLKVDAASPFPFTFDVEISEYDIRAFIESMDIPENRMLLN